MSIPAVQSQYFQSGVMKKTQHICKQSSMDSNVKLEFAVEMTCAACENDLKKALSNVAGVDAVKIDMVKKQVVIDTSLPSIRVQELIEETGRKAVLLGMGSSQVERLPISAAVAEVYGAGGQRGIVRFVATANSTCLVDATIDGLTPNQQHRLQIHEYGDMSHGCDSCGEVYKFIGCQSDMDADPSHCAVTSDQGRAEFRYEKKPVEVWDLIGRSVVIHENGSNSVDKRIACGVIARSSGLFQNSKRICACSGATLWDEREAAKRS